MMILVELDNFTFNYSCCDGLYSRAKAIYSIFHRYIQKAGNPQCVHFRTPCPVLNQIHPMMKSIDYDQMLHDASKRLNFILVPSFYLNSRTSNLRIKLCKS